MKVGYWLGGQSQGTAHESEEGTAHESEEIELQGVMIWFLINSRVRVMISDS